MREEDIRPKALLDQYLALSAEDARLFFPDPLALPSRACPGCGSDNSSTAFIKLGFRYGRCKNCSTLYADPCPDDETLAALYRDSRSSIFWAQEFFPAVAENRRKSIFAPRSQEVTQLMERLGNRLATVTDVGAGLGLFLDEIHKLDPTISRIAVEPSGEMAAVCRKAGHDVYEGFSWEAENAPEVAAQADLVTCFEVIEHVPDVVGFLSSLAKLARPGGFVLATGLCGDGFDIQVLGTRSKAISPPHHLNFLSRQGVAFAVKRAGLELIDFLTPGKLDVDIVRNTLADDSNAVGDPFLHQLISDPDPEVGRRFQEFLVTSRLSSHMWIVARRPKMATT